MCAPHRVKLAERLLEVSVSPINDLGPILDYTLRNNTLKIWVIIRPTKSNLKSSRRIEIIATLGGTQAVAETDRVVASLGGNDHADLFPPPVANILEDSVVRRISHSINDDVGFYRKVKSIVRRMVCAPHRVKLTEDSTPEGAGRSRDRTP